MSRTSRALASLLLASGLAAGTTPAQANEHDAQTTLSEVRRATAHYHDPAAAQADGYVPNEHCVSHPQLGGMGFHFVNPAELADPVVESTRPEILLYEALPSGKLKLVAVEWFAVDPDQDLATDDGRPSLFGVPFDGPMPGHEPGMPAHFDLHAWIWKHNPAGTLAAWNPRVRCAE